MKRNPTVTIGIPAYNEEANIGFLLHDILKQNRGNFIFEKIIIYSDGSTDKTVAISNNIKNKLIKIINAHERHGKVFGLKKIFQELKSDILVIFDADIRLKNKRVIEKLIKPFYEDSNVALVGGSSKPYLPKTFFEKAVYSTFLVFYETRNQIKGGHNIFGCTGHILGMRKEFTKEIRFPKIINEDDFLYFSCISKGYIFRHVKEAEVFYKLPANLSDYLRQVFRSDPEAVSQNFTKYFGDLVRKEYHRGFLFYAKNVFKVFKKNPIGVAYISIVNLFCKPLFPIISRQYKLNWYTAKSTK